jgi:hypothetical protein
LGGKVHNGVNTLSNEKVVHKICTPSVTFHKLEILGGLGGELKEWVTPTWSLASCSIVLVVSAFVSFSMLASVTNVDCEAGL